MARVVPDIDYVARLQSLRDSYVVAYPRQRLHVIRQRLDDHHFGPNRLVTSVSAVEAYARCLALRLRAKSREDLKKVYPKYRDKGPKGLVAEYAKARGVDNLPSFFGEDNWKLFGYAIDYRNVITHECTYLGLDVFPSLIGACEAVLTKLEELADSRAKRT
jgi:hypothetical protein